MPSKTRRTKSYYYQNRWEHGKTVSAYLGSGPVAQMWADLDRDALAEREQRHLEAQQLAQELDELQAIVDDFQHLVRQITRAALLASGAHTHKGQWRIKRGPKPQ